MSIESKRSLFLYSFFALKNSFSEAAVIVNGFILSLEIALFEVVFIVGYFWNLVAQMACIHILLNECGKLKFLIFFF